MENLIVYLPYVFAGILALIGTYILEKMIELDGAATIVAFLVVGIIAYFALGFIGIF